MGKFQRRAIACKMGLPKVRDQEVGGSNPLAPTILFSTAYTLSPSEKVVVANTANKAVGLRRKSDPAEHPRVTSIRAGQMNFRSCNQLRVGTAMPEVAFGQRGARIVPRTIHLGNTRRSVAQTRVVISIRCRDFRTSDTSAFCNAA